MEVSSPMFINLFVFMHMCGDFPIPNNNFFFQHLALCFPINAPINQDEISGHLLDRFYY